jgi:2-polyprenyl-3-methyl-5-hydroxy-6-metoxy-1,4-benzoquinol methylase
MSSHRSAGRPPGSPRQAALNGLFGAEVDFWSELYSGESVLSAVHRYRTRLTLRWIDELRLAPGSKVLEVGCGPGLLAVELARRGLDVDATDTVEAMLDRARRAAAHAGVADQVRFSPGDVHDLGFDDRRFNLVVGLGVLPWIDRPEAALAEIARVLAPSSLAIVSINNRTPLHVLGDPARLALLAPLRDAAREALATIRGTTATRRGRPITFARPAEFAGQLDRAGLRLIRAQPFGFGPFTMLGRELLPGPVGVRLERRLQRRAEAPDPGLLGYLAAQYLVSAERATD